MLHYLNHGLRDYYRNPIPIHERGVWEFQAITEGAGAPVFPGEREELSSRRLWVFAPDCVHGWTGDPSGPAEIFVLQFAWIPSAIRKLVPSAGVASIGLTVREIALIKRIYSSFRSLSPGSDLRNELLTQRNLASLGLILVAREEARKPTVSTSRKSNIVQSSLKQYRDELPGKPLLPVLASSVNLSSSHLRRLYWSVLHSSPRNEFLKWRMQRAKYLLGITNSSIKEVAFEVGYSSQAAFSRAFKKNVNKSPQMWRRFQREGTGEWVP